MGRFAVHVVKESVVLQRQAGQIDDGLALGSGAEIRLVGDALLIEREDVADEGPGVEQGDREIVVVAPDGCFAAFLIYWVDPISRSGLFEPVGCHKDFQRLCLTRALMYEGMRRMISHGMTMAIVLHQPEQENPASAALYRSVDFSLLYTISNYQKKIK